MTIWPDTPARLDLEPLLDDDLPAHAAAHRDAGRVQLLRVDVPARSDHQQRMGGDSTDDFAVDPCAAFEDKVSGEDGPFANEADDIRAFNAFR
jgi:hypothetical protein